MTLNRNVAPNAGSVIDLSEKALNSPDFLKQIVPESFLLDNGIPVHLLQTGSQDVVKIDIVSDAGQWYANHPLEASFTNQMLRLGTKSKTSQQLAEAFDFYGAFLHNTAEKDRSVYTLFSLNKHLEKTLQLLVSIFEEPSFCNEELEILSQQRKQQFLINQSRPAWLAARHFNKSVFGASNPYGMMASEGDYETINSKLLSDFFQKQYGIEGMTIVVSGMITKKIKSLLNATFGQFPKTINNFKNERDFSNSLAPEKINLKAGNGMQTAIRLGKRMFDRHHPDFDGMALVNTILGGYFGSRLMTNIREEKGLTYGIGSGLFPFLHDGIFFVTTEVNSENSQLAVDEIYKEIEILRNSPVSNGELKLVKNYILGQFVRSLDGLFALSDTFRSLNDCGMGRENLISSLRKLDSFSPEDIMALAEKYLKVSEFSLVTVGK